MPLVVYPDGSSFVRAPKGRGYRMYGGTSGYVGWKPKAAAGSIDFTMPSAFPASNGYWLSDSAGNLSFTLASVLNAATVTTNANLTGPVTSTGNATAIANGAISNAMLANSAVANLSGTNTGDQTSVSGNAGTVSTISGMIASGANITITGSGTSGFPYSIAASGSSGITALTGDVTASGSGSVAATVAKIAGVAVGTPTGTGNVVFSASPTLTGTVTCATVTSSGVISTSQGGAASAPALSVTGTVFTGGTGTTTQPLVYVNSGTSPTTWSTNGTLLGGNSVSGFAGKFIDYHLNGGSSLFNVDANGNVLLNTTSAYNADSHYGNPGNLPTGIQIFSTGTNGIVSLDLLRSDSVTGLRISNNGNSWMSTIQNVYSGAQLNFWSQNGNGFSIMNASGITVIGVMTGATGSGTNGSGSGITMAGGAGTGNAVPPLVKLQSAAISPTSGTATQAIVDRLTIGASKVLTNNSATSITNCTLASNTVVGGLLNYTVEVFDGTDLQVESGTVTYNAINKGGVFSGNTALKSANQQSVSSGTLAVTFTITAANPAVIQVNANSSLTPSTGYPRMTYMLKNLTQQAVAIQ